LTERASKEGGIIKKRKRRERERGKRIVES
jgi:hypothetical protein